MVCCPPCTAWRSRSRWWERRRLQATWQGQGCGVLGKGRSTVWGAAGVQCRTLLLWGHWGSSEGLLGRAGTKQNPAELGAAAPTVEVPAGLQVAPKHWGCPPTVQEHEELPCALLLTQVCRQGCASAVSQGSMHRGCQHHSCICTQSSSIFLAHKVCVTGSQRHSGQKRPQDHQLQVLN